MNATPQIHIGPPDGESELQSFTRIVGQALFFGDADLDTWLEREGQDNVRVARMNGDVVGGLVSQPMGQWFGGKSVPMSGIRAVGIAPERRSAGVASVLMRTALREMYASNVPLSVLYPATQPVYRRPGFEQAGMRLTYRMPTAAIDVRDRTLTMRSLSKDEHQVVREVYDRFAQRTSGNLDRTDWLWRRILEPPPWFKPVETYVVERDGIAEGHVVVAQAKGDPLTHLHHLELPDVAALTPDAGRRLLTFLADHRSMAETVTWSGPPADPWMYLLAEQSAKVVRRIDWMLRIVNVPAALEARGYPQPLAAEVHLDVADDVLAENHGRWVMELAGGRAQVRKGGRGDLHIDVRGLAALYSGHLDPAALMLTGYLDGTDDALGAAGAAFSGPAPWMSDMF